MQHFRCITFVYDERTEKPFENGGLNKPDYDYDWTEKLMKIKRLGLRVGLFDIYARLLFRLLLACV